MKTETVGRMGELTEKYSMRVAKLPAEYQAILFADLETAFESRLRVLERVA
jgi:hypothetical protein